MFRFIHSSDLHLGKRFGNFEGDLPGRLREARHAVLGKLAQHAREQNAPTVLLAGDTFDSETPAPDVRRQAMMEMAQHEDIRWIILPGNHDSLQASELWQRMAGDAPKNVILAVEPSPIAVGPNAYVLPAPCTFRRPGRDLTEWMGDSGLDDTSLRIGLAHGAIQNFTEDAATHDVIAPDRARQSGLDYLALGDWHGAMQVDERTFYSGTPEPDRFKHNRPGEAFVVSISARGAKPELTAVPTGTFDWRSLDLHLMTASSASGALDSILPDMSQRRHSLWKINASGHTRVAEHSALLDRADQTRHDFAWFDLSLADLEIEYDPADLDSIELSGALREAANALMADVNNAALSAQDRSVAGSALSRLYRHLQETSK